MLEMAKSKTEMARQQELMASAQEKLVNINNIQADADKKSMESDLNLVKLAMELEDVQFNQIRQAFELAEFLKQSRSAEIETAQA